MRVTVYCRSCSYHKKVPAFSFGAKAANGMPICNTCYEKIQYNVSKEKPNQNKRARATKKLRENFESYTRGFDVEA